MPDWMSPESLTQQTAGIVNLTHVFAGIYLWEVLMSLTFEWEYLTRRRKFKWPMVCYFLVRYVALSAMVGSIVGFDVKSGLDCKSFFTFLQMAGNCARGLATINLALRTIAVWQRDRYIVVGIVLLILGHWSLIFQGVLLEAEEVPGQGCQIVHTNTKILTADFVYSMIFDLIILLLTAYKVLQLKTQSGLVSLLFYDGLIYFLCAFTANLLAAIFMILDLSPVMSIMFNVPAVVVCAIASTRAVRSLANYTNSGPNVFYSGTIVHGTPIAFHRDTQDRTMHPSELLSLPIRDSRQPAGVHVQMETLVTADRLEGANRPSNRRRSVTLGEDDLDDLESQPNSTLHKPLDLKTMQEEE